MAVGTTAPEPSTALVKLSPRRASGNACGAKGRRAIARSEPPPSTLLLVWGRQCRFPTACRSSRERALVSSASAPIGRSTWRGVSRNRWRWCTAAPARLATVPWRWRVWLARVFLRLRRSEREAAVATRAGAHGIARTDGRSTDEIVG
jgi:hypothetical protein